MWIQAFEQFHWLTHFMPLVFFYTPWKQQARGFLMFSGGIEKDQWNEIELKFWYILTSAWFKELILNKVGLRNIIYKETIWFFRCSHCSSFNLKLHKALWELIPHVHNAFSSAAYHWIFVVLSDLLSETLERSDLERLLNMLLDVSKVYGSKIPEIQKMLNAK